MAESGRIMNGVVAIAPPAGLFIRPLGDGLEIDVPDDFRSDQSLMLASTSEGGAHIVLRMGVRSFLRVFQTQSASTQFEAVLSEGSELVHSRMQEGDALQSRVDVELLKDSQYKSFVVTLGGTKVREDVKITLEGRDAHCDLRGLTLGFSNDHIEHNTAVEHRVPHTTSLQAYRAIVGDHGASVYNGRIFVAQDAQKTDAKQSSRNLILSHSATANSKPELEIYADDVKCAHGCTVGRLDDDAMFYLRSRGLSTAQAMRMLTFAFADEVLDADASGRVHAWLEQRFGVPA